MAPQDRDGISCQPPKWYAHRFKQRVVKAIIEGKMPELDKTPHQCCCTPYSNKEPGGESFPTQGYLANMRNSNANAMWDSRNHETDSAAASEDAEKDLTSPAKSLDSTSDRITNIESQTIFDLSTQSCEGTRGCGSCAGEDSQLHETQL